MNLRRVVAATTLTMLLLAWSMTASSRGLAVDEGELVRVEIATLAVAVNGAPVVLLRDPNRSDVIPIIIGPAEAQAIMRAMEEVDMPRPMTHDLFGDVISALDARLERVIVDDLVDNTFLGILEFSVAGRDEPVRVDSRPSDAMALALRAGAAIHVTPPVMEAAEFIEYEGLDDQVVTAVGVTVGEVTDDLRGALELPDREGLLVNGVAGPAADAGLEPGALLLDVNGETPSSPMGFLDLVRGTPEGEDVRLRFWQDGEEREIEVPTDVPDQEPRDLPDGEGIEL